MTSRAHHILDLLSAAERHPSEVHLETLRGSHRTCFSDLWSLSARIANAIDTSLPEGRVAGVLTPSADVVGCLVGSLRTGRDFVSLPLPGRGQDRNAYCQQLKAILELSGAVVLVVEAAYAALVESLVGPLSCPVVVAECLAESTKTPLRRDREPGRLIQFSSGTTGTPKGLCLSGEAIGASVEATLDALRIGDGPEAFCAWVPLSHDMGLIGGLLATWVGSTRVPYRYICISPELFLARPSMWMESCAASGATITAAPTFAYHIAARHLVSSPMLNLSRLRAAIVGAEPIGEETLRAFGAAADPHGLRDGALCPAYGLAEATLVVSISPPGTPWTTRRVSVGGRESTYVSCGKPLDCIAIAAPDITAGAGPIKIAGPALCSGYIPARSPPTEGWLDTGDLGALSGGELFVTGRSDDLLCVAGRNIFAWELEHAAGAVSLVRAGDCIVVTDGRGRYVALFEPRTVGGGGHCEEALLEVRRALAAVAGIGPAAVGCLPRGTLPKTPSGKIRRNHVAADLGHFVGTCIAYREF